MQLSIKSPPALAAGALVIVAAAGLALWWLFGSADEVVADHLDGAQLNRAAAELDRAGIPYGIDHKVAGLRVPRDSAAQARQTLQDSGQLRAEAAGFELFDKTDFGMTEFSQRINYQRAIEGEIARTVSALAEVRFTRVHLVLPEHSLFQSEQRKPRASVTVFLDRDAALSAEHIRGIQRIAASAVPDLDEANVTVLDQTGTVLSDGTDMNGGQGAQGRLLQKRAIEDYIAAKIRSVLVPAVGSGHFAVNVDVTLDLNQKTTTTEKVLSADNNGGVRHLKESSNRGHGEGGSDELLREVEYAVGRQSEQIVHGTGEIRRLQVGVVIDSAVTAADIAHLRELIAATAGVDVARGDYIAVVQSHLAAPAAATASATVAAAAPRATTGPDWLLPGLLLGCAAAGGGAVLLATRPRRLDDQALQQLRLRLQTWVDADRSTVDDA